jgi:hypothetical protein
MKKPSKGMLKTQRICKRSTAVYPYPRAIQMVIKRKGLREEGFA